LRCGGVQHGLVQLAETLGGYGRKQLVLVPEMAVRRVVGDAGPPRHFAQGEAREPGFGNQLNRRFEKSVLQVAVVVRPFPSHRTITTLANNVDSGNMVV